MIEVNLSYDLLPNFDQKAYTEWAKKTVGGILKASGLIEFRANRNMLGDPQVRSTSVWKTLADWANYVDSDEWKTREQEARGFVKNIKVEIWGPSPIVTEPLRPN